MFSADDVRHMERALTLAERGRYSTHPNPRVGCVLVSGNRVVGEGWHRRAGGPHAEIAALASAGADAAGATAYLNLEPCAHAGRTGPCATALVEAGVQRVVASMEDPNPLVAGGGRRRLQEAGIDVQTGLMEEQARRLNAGFIARMTRDRPRVIVKLAASLDGRTAMASGESRWISSEEAREDVQRLRAESSAILTGIGTVLSDDPSMNVRSDAYDTGGRQPVRVVLDSHLRMPPAARMLQNEGRTIVMTGCEDEARLATLSAAGASVDIVPLDCERLDVGVVLARLATLECNDILVEAGPTLCGSLTRAGLVDELIIYLAPHLMGGDARGMFDLPGLARMADRVQLAILDVATIGGDLRVRASVSGQG